MVVPSALKDQHATRFSKKKQLLVEPLLWFPAEGEAPVYHLCFPRSGQAETFTFSAGFRKGRTFITLGIYTAPALIHTLR